MKETLFNRAISTGFVAGTEESVRVTESLNYHVRAMVRGYQPPAWHEL